MDAACTILTDLSLQPPLSPLELSWAASAAPRYLAAHGSVSSARSALQATLAWRRATLPPPPALPPCLSCRAAPAAHCITCIGLLPDSRPCVYLSPPRATHLDTVSCTSHLISELEAMATLPGAAPQAVWLMDMRGFSYRRDGLNIGVGVSFARVLQNHYPERLGLFLLCCAPMSFNLFMSALRPFLDARTAAKIVVLRTPAEVTMWIDAHAVGASDAEGEGGAVEGSAPSVAQWLKHAFTLPPVAGALPPCLPRTAPLAVALRGEDASTCGVQGAGDADVAVAGV